MACVGIYGVLAYTVTTRRHEIGVRLALGSQPGVIGRRFLANGLRLGTIGVAIGIPAALAAGQLMRGILFGVNPMDATTMLMAGAALAIATSVAGYIPARSAARVDPLLAIRME
jgi:putative ABC transport system permease protein